MSQQKDKRLAVSLLREREEGAAHTYAAISERTGYGRKQLTRLLAQIREGLPDEEILRHGNAGRRPPSPASDSEAGLVRGLKESYGAITMAHLKDICHEDVVRNPERAGLVRDLGLAERSESWFRDLFRREGWRSPAERPAEAAGAQGRHDIREPSPRRGMLVQAGGTFGDWLGDGDTRVPRLAVDDATSSVLGGSFMPTECHREYARMSREVLSRYGVPRAVYADKTTVLRSPRTGAPTGLARALESLGAKVIFAGSPQAKGRVERCNRTVQGRLANDLLRFGASSYDAIDEWFNGFYAPYLNAKPSFAPADPRDAFLPAPEGIDYGKTFRATYPRVVREGMVSLGNVYYKLVDPDGVIDGLRNGTRVLLRLDPFSEERHVEHLGARYERVEWGRRRRGLGHSAESRREVDEILRGVPRFP
ncbi:hypothetical protein [Rubneribacter sp.]|nr:hypothetical protein [Candidatus Rubneribacter avistercoris]